MLLLAKSKPFSSFVVSLLHADVTLTRPLSVIHRNVSHALASTNQPLISTDMSNPAVL